MPVHCPYCLKPKDLYDSLIVRHGFFIRKSDLSKQFGRLCALIVFMHSLRRLKPLSSALLSITLTVAFLFSLRANAVPPSRCTSVFAGQSGLDQAVQKLLGTRGHPDRPQIEGEVRRQLRREFRRISERHGATGRFESVELLRRYHYEVIQRPFAEQLAKLKVKVVDRVLRDSNGDIIDTSDASYSRADGERIALYVMNARGELFISKFHSVDERFFHSSLAGGEEVAAAGMIRIVRGKIVFVSNSSGHYQPSYHSFAQVLYVLEAQGIRIDAMDIQFALRDPLRVTLNRSDEPE